MRLQTIFRRFNLVMGLAIAPILVPVFPVAAETLSPLVVVVDGGNNWLMQDPLYNKLRNLNAEIRYTTHNDFNQRPSLSNPVDPTQPDTHFLIDGQHTLNNIPGDRPIVLIGDGAGARSILKLLPLINRNVQLVALIDPTTQDPVLYSNASSPSDNVNIFLSYFRVASPIKECANAIQCQQFTAYGNADSPNTNVWIQNDITQNIELVLKPNLNQ